MDVLATEKALRSLAQATRGARAPPPPPSPPDGASSGDEDDHNTAQPSQQQSSTNGGLTPSAATTTSMTATTATAPSSSTSATAASAAAAAAAGPAKKKKKKGIKRVNVSFTKYPVIREVAEELGFTLEPEEEELEKFDFNLIWSDTVLPLQKLVRLSNWQRSNHFPSMHLITRKVHLGLTLGRMRKIFPTHYAFFPRTWSLRSERQQFARFYNSLPAKKVFIMKPNAGCQGRGIVLSKDPLSAVEDLDNYVVQEYISKPLLIEGKKFDLRVYALVTSMRHPSIFVFNDGLVRMCAEDYEKPTDENIGNACKHLTNYAVNKHSEHFVFNSDTEGRGDSGNKRDFVWFNRWLTEAGHDAAKFWDRVHHMIVKTVLAAQPQVTHVYNSCFPHSNDGFTCFEVLGFDVLVDEKVRPVLMEVNHTPSFACDTPLDHRIKKSLILETWNIINMQASDRARHLEREKAQFARRIQQTKPAAAGGATAAVATAPPPLPPPPAPLAAAASTTMLPIDAMLSTTNVAASQQDQLTAAAESEAMLSTEMFVEEHRRKEDRRAVNYKRVYPSRVIERQVLYETILSAAKAASAVQTTASQEQRQNEVRAERERREANRAAAAAGGGGGGGSGSAATAAAAAVSGVAGGGGGQQQLPAMTSGRRPNPRSAGSAHLRVTPQPPLQPPSAGNSLPTTPTSSRSGSAGGTGGTPLSGAAGQQQQPFQRSSVVAAAAAATASSSSRNGGGGTSRRVGGGGDATTAAAAAGGKPRRSKEEAERQRQRLAEQMERHRRRMVLGPRLSVFQLREAQLAAMFAGDAAAAAAAAAAVGGAGGGGAMDGFGGGQQQGAASAAATSLVSPTSAMMMGASAIRVPHPQLQTQLQQQQPSSGENIGVALHLQHRTAAQHQQEQFHAILSQLARYQVVPDAQYHMHDFPSRQQQQQQQQQQQRGGADDAVRHHPGYESFDDDEYDRYGEEEEEEE